MTKPALLTVHLRHEADFLLARQRAKQIAAFIGFEIQDQTRIATAVSEIARNAFEYATGGRAEFFLDDTPAPQFRIVVTDTGKGIPALESIYGGTYTSPSGMGLGITGARRLLDGFDLQTSAQGTIATLTKHIPAHKLPPPTPAQIAAHLAKYPAGSSGSLRDQNQELLNLLGELRARETELSRLNIELEETNRGVLVLYAELEDKARAVQQASEMKTRFLSGVTHELRTPLNSIISLSRLLLHRIDGELNPEQEKQVGFILRSAQSLSEMVNDLLDLAKIEAGKTTVKLTEVDVHDTLAALRGMFRPLATSDRVELIFDLPEAGALRLHTDEGKLAQILRNFIANALKFTEQGTVTVKAVREPAPSADRNDIVFSVADTGIGIAPEHHALVMQEWGQVDVPTTRAHKGSGLGLPLSRSLAEILGGSVHFTSVPGMGSTFYLALPALTVVPPSALLAGSAPPHILMADDDEVSRYLLRRRLSTLTTATIHETESGQECLEAIAQNRPALLFLDLMMPGMGGIDVVRHLRQDPATQDLPIVLLTARLLTGEERFHFESLGLQIISKRLGDTEEDQKHQDEQRQQIERALLQVGLKQHAPWTRQSMIQSRERRILYVDDTEEQRYAMRRILEGAGFTVVEAASGAEAFRQLAPPACEQILAVVLDVRLPDMSGFDVCRRIKADPSTEAIPVLQISASFADPTLRAAGLSGGADAYVAQPVHPTELLSLVNALIRSHDSEKTLRFQAEISASLSASLDHEQTVRTIKTIFVPRVCDACTVYLHPQLHAHTSQTAATTPSSVQNPPSSTPPPHLPGLHSPALDAIIEQVAASGPTRLLNPATLIVPLAVGRKRLGALVFTLDGVQRRYVHANIPLIEDLADRAALALQNATLFTAQQHAQAALVQSEKLAAAGRLSAAIAHEINNPLEALTNLMFLIDTSPETPDTIRGYAQEALSELSRLTHIARQSLGFYRELTGPTTFDLNESVEDTLNIYLKRFGAKRIHVEREYTPGLQLTGVKGEIRQVISNLLVNAYDAVSEEGTLRVETNATPAGDVQFRILNTGPGIPEDVLPRIFDPFFSTKEGTGTGLGLWVSDTIVQKHGGSILVHNADPSRPNPTIAFEVTLPREFAGS